ncbi:hypothetical protein [Leptolyngbya sp. 7M]|uniref:hypothetical protein n=1 Tax=Leptolyngbya sp. 7M TaxID=2812896 RepID=UPI001B8DA692|nr:hypothetical protein [Leptolyngbya sp. 7M]QYO67081.1 hypothetical protein JVX88_09875 [Leptolyngbya sp. 7M]
MKNTFSASILLIFFGFTAVFGQTAIWSVNSRADVLKGDAEGVSIDQNGAVSIAPKLSTAYETGQPYIWSTTIDAAGNIFIGTGSEGRIYRVAANGSGTLFSDLPELNVSALVIGRGGELFAGTSPDGKVYKIDSTGKAEVYFDPKEKYIWSLAVMADGGLAVGTGDAGKLYRVRSANASPESSLILDSSETHIFRLAASRNGEIYAGTDPGGLVLRIDANGKPFALLDSPLREIRDLVYASDGSLYVLSLADSVSSAKSAESSDEKPANNTVSVERPSLAAPPQPAKSKYDLSGAKSAVYRILSDGSHDLLWSSPNVVGFSLLPKVDGGGVLLGTSDKGRLYSISNEGRETLLLQTDAAQISRLFRRDATIYAATSNQGMLMSIGPESAAEGVFRSAVLDAKTQANWGDMWWRSAGNVLIETRSGNTEVPNETWSPWTQVSSSGTRGRVGVPSSRFIQWRAVLRPGSSAAVLNEVNLAFAGRNLAPELLSVSILPANVGLLPNPPAPIDPNIELSGIAPAVFGIPNQPIPPRRAYQRGARAFQWVAEDRNGDSLVFDIYLKEANDTEFKLLRSSLSENFITLDGLSLADGRYRLKIIARDSPSNPAGQSLSGEIVSEPFDIDNTQPVVSLIGTPQVSGGRGRVTFAARDASGYLVKAEYSINGGSWKSVTAEDGISDSPEERYMVEFDLGEAREISVTLRVFDSVGNIGNARALIRR